MYQHLKKLFQYRALVQVLVSRDLKARYRGTFLGFLWSFLNPMIQAGIFVLVFSVFLRVQMKNYSLFLLCGILPWVWFSNALNDATQSIINNGGLIKKIQLPSEIFPLVSISANMFHLLFSLPVLFLFLAFSHIPLSWPLLFFPVILVVQFVFSYSLSLFFSSVVVEFRDLLQLVTNLLMIWYFLTPIIYPLEMVPERFKFLIQLNPMTHIIGAYQDIFFYQRMPSLSGLTILFVGSWFLLRAGFSFFEVRKDLFAEAI